MKYTKNLHLRLQKLPWGMMSSGRRGALVTLGCASISASDTITPSPASFRSAALASYANFLCRCSSPSPSSTAEIPPPRGALSFLPFFS